MATLTATYIGAIQLSDIRQRFLRKLSGHAELLQTKSEGNLWILGRATGHDRQIIVAMLTWSPRTISHINNCLGAN